MVVGVQALLRLPSPHLGPARRTGREAPAGLLRAVSPQHSGGEAANLGRPNRTRTPAPSLTHPSPAGCSPRFQEQV